MAAKLRDLGEVINDCTLVLNVLRSLNDKFGHMWIHFRCGPFPSFDEVRNELLLEELITSTRLLRVPSLPTPPRAPARQPRLLPAQVALCPLLPAAGCRIPPPRHPPVATPTVVDARTREAAHGRLSTTHGWARSPCCLTRGGDAGHQQGQQRPPAQQNAQNPRTRNPQTAQVF